jgi:hypothetical protein
VIEAAAKLSFHGAIEFLVQRGTIPSSERERWVAARKLRNLASHPQQAVVNPPGAVLGTLTLCARDIDGLFAARQIDPG